MASELVSWRFLLQVYFLFFSCPSSCFLHSLGSVLGGNDTDRLALLAFKADITSDPFGALSSWNESTHFCQWIGVTCGRRHQRVTVLSLGRQELAGPISPHVGNLSFLRELWLRHNRLSHAIPQELSRLRRLQILCLGNNSLTGEIPVNISAAKSLTVVELSLNPLVGKIPAELGALSKLKGLYISENNLTGPIPSALGNLTSLEVIAAGENRISGNIPEELGRLSNLQNLSLVVNMLVGTIPSSIFNLSSIQIFEVSANQIQGSLPSNLEIVFPNLTGFLIAQNLFSGSIPFSISNASKLQSISLSYNQLTGNVPPLEKLHDLQDVDLSSNFLGTGKANDLSFFCSLTNATSLHYLSFGVNNFGGVLPECISNFSTKLREIDLAYNKIGGKIPFGIENLANLVLIDMYNNRLTGEIPSSISKFKNLQQLGFGGNEFSGNIPPALGNLSMLVDLYLNVNNFHGKIPSELGNCKRLQLLSLERNNLIGTIPSEVLGVSTLLNLIVYQNHFSGPLPVEIGNLRNLEVLDVSENMFSGEIPSTISSCVTLRLLNASGNNLQGKLPSSLSYLKGIEELDLSCNNFSGEIPFFLGNRVFLKKLNLSFNNFEGMVPEMGIFKNASLYFVQGNKKLCGGIPELHLRDCNSKGSKSKRSIVILKLVIPTTCGLVGLLLVLMFIYHSWIRKRTKVPSFRILGNTFEKVSYQDLLKATGGFSQSNLIGQGGFGLVYKGILDEKVVAVKVLNLEFGRAYKSFIVECKALKNIKHRNLVKVVTACSSIDYQGKDFKALVYEFMANGSLEEWLHQNYENKDDDNNDDDDAKEPALIKRLNLLQRLNISIDVASAVDYLHNHCAESIVHCDLKSSNVLLDNEMVGHVGDFGLARFFPESAASNSSAYQSSSIGIRGSIGYVPPEYGMGNEMSRSGDVYSFGILLMETFTGKRPTDKLFSDNFSLRDFVKMALPVSEKVAGIVDPTLFQTREETIMAASTSTSVPIAVTLADHNFNPVDSHRILEYLISIFNIGIACSEEQPRARMGIHDVVSQLHVIRSIYIGSSNNEVPIRRAKRVN